MQIGIDNAGKVWMVGDAVASEVWNGIEITAMQLTEEQEAAYLSLPADRSGLTFDGQTFTAIPPVPADEKLALQADIDELEAAQLLPRVTREFTLNAGVSMVLLAQGISPLQATQQQIAAVTTALSDPKSPLYNVGYVKLKAFDDSIVALRAQLAALE